MDNQNINIQPTNINVDALMRENLELMYNIQKNRENFCSLVGGC